MRYKEFVEVEVTPELVERARAAASGAEAIHHDLCQKWDPDAPLICTCGTPALLTDFSRQLCRALIRDVQARTGLNTEEIGQLAGVGAEPSHQWAAIGDLTDEQASMLYGLRALADAIPKPGPERCRRILFAPVDGLGTLAEDFQLAPTGHMPATA